MWQITGTGVCHPLPAPGLMDGLHGPPLTCVCTVICTAKGSCSSHRQLGEAHLLGVRQPQPPASWEEGKEGANKVVEQGTRREKGQRPRGTAPSAQNEPRG